MLYELYLITNKLNNKRYVGQTSSSIGYELRFKQHIEVAGSNKKHKSVLHRSIKKNGASAFEIKRILKDIEESRIDFLENVWIKKLNTYYLNGSGYNMTRGGQGIHGYRHTLETRRKMSLANSGKKHSAESKQKILDTKMKRQSQVNRSNKQWLLNCSLAAKKRFENAPGTFTGKHHTDETKQKLAESHSIKVAAYYKETGELFKVFNSSMEASKYLNTKGITSNKSAFCRILTICHGRDKSAYGYIWKFIEDVTTIPKGSREGDELPSEVHVNSDLN